MLSLRTACAPCSASRTACQSEKALFRLSKARMLFTSVVFCDRIVLTCMQHVMLAQRGQERARRMRLGHVKLLTNESRTEC